MIEGLKREAPSLGHIVDKIQYKRFTNPQANAQRVLCQEYVHPVMRAAWGPWQAGKPANVPKNIVFHKCFCILNYRVGIAINLHS